MGRRPRRFVTWRDERRRTISHQMARRTRQHDGRSVIGGGVTGGGVTGSGVTAA